MEKEAISYFEDNIRHEIVENAIVIEDDGRVIQFIGETDSVDIFDVNLKGAIVTHNHPESEGIVAFGEDDFIFLREPQDLKEFRCTNTEYNYRMVVLKDLNEVVYNDIYVEGFKYFGSPEFEPQDAAMRVLQERGYIIYERKPVDT